MPKRDIFREQALQQYIQRKEKTVLPLWITPPIFLCLWVLLGLLILAGSVAWFTEEPVTVKGSGIITINQWQNTVPTARIFLPMSMNSPTSSKLPLQTNAPVRFTLLNGGKVLDARITEFDLTILSPNEARQRFLLENDPCRLSQGPTVVLNAQIDTSIAKTLDGSCGSAEVQIGSRRILSSLLGIEW